MKKIVFICAIALAACGDQDTVDLSPDAEVVPTRRDTLKVFAGTWCATRAVCGISEDLGQCYRHNIHHLCELNLSCDEPFESENLEACLDEMRDVDGPTHQSCTVIRFSSLPAGCEKFWEDWSE